MTNFVVLKFYLVHMHTMTFSYLYYAYVHTYVICFCHKLKCYLILISSIITAYVYSYAIYHFIAPHNYCTLKALLTILLS